MVVAVYYVWGSQYLVIQLLFAGYGQWISFRWYYFLGEEQ